MNDKLKAFANRNVRVVATGITGRGSKKSDSLVTVTKATEGGKRCVLRFSLHARTVAKLGWIKNDVIDFRVTEDGAFVMFRSPNGKGSHLCGPTGNSSTRMYVRAQVVKEFFDAIEEAVGRDVEIENGMIAFSI
jgi:hypothetical protein